MQKFKFLSWCVKQDQKGRTPLSCALDQKNLEITQLLLDTGKVQLDIRVRETERAEETVPIIYKALHTDCPIEIWRCLSKHFKQNMLLEKDSVSIHEIYKFSNIKY